MSLDSKAAADFYSLLQWFLFYGVLGWIVESLYMSFCNKKLTNRGFMKGPFIPIYGFGALLAYFLLRGFVHAPIALYFLGAFMATAFEYVTALIMQSLLGAVWWDYKDKPFNYKGILCLESSIAWGFYTVGFFYLVHPATEGFLQGLPYDSSLFVMRGLIAIFLADFLSCLYEELREVLSPSMETVKESQHMIFRKE